ncbi:MAG: glycosyltransferase [Candidatus Hodarchaeales archaeon]|jgi:glycosyltransferase involved in cell wall biosynthesis
MKIVQACEYTAPARDSMGAERYLEALSKGLIANGHEVFLLINKDSQTDIAPIVTEVSEDVDIVHYHGGFPEDYGVLNTIPWITTNHGGGYDTPETFSGIGEYKKHIVSVSKFVMDKSGLHQYVHTGIDQDEFIFRDKKDDYYLWIGGTDWGENKGLFSAINLARKLKIKLKIAGSGYNWNNIERIKQNSFDNIEYLGSINGKEKAEVIAGAKAIFMIGNILDACPMTVSEALISGTPVIARNIAVHPELINSDIGFLCDNESDIVRAILLVDKIDPYKCRKYAMENFSKEKLAEKYVNIYKNVVEYGNVISKR